MVVIHVQIENLVDDVLLDGGFGVNIITKELRATLGPPKRQPAPCNIWMANQTITKPIGLIHDLKILVHGIPYNVTFTIMQNNVLDCTYFMHLRQPWLRDVKVSHDRGTNIIIIHGNGMVKTIVVTKHLRSQTKCVEVLYVMIFKMGSHMKKKTLYPKQNLVSFLSYY